MTRKDISLGSIDVGFFGPIDKSVQWLEGLDQVLKGCNTQESEVDDIEKILLYFFEKRQVFKAFPDTIKEPSKVSNLALHRLLIV